MDKRTEFENIILELVRNSVETHNSEATKHGVEVKYDFSSNDNSSEIEITLAINNELVDIIEFFVWRNGKPHASIQEIETWLKEALNDAFGKLT